MLPKNLKKLRANTTCSALSLDSRKYKSIDKLIGNVFCPDTMCSDILCVHKKIFQCSQCSSTCQVHNISFKEQTNFFLNFVQEIYNIEGTQKTIQVVIGDIHCPIYLFIYQKCVYLSNSKSSSFHDCKKCKACSHVFNIPFKDQKLTHMLLDGDCTHYFAKKVICNYEKRKVSSILKKFILHSQSGTLKILLKKAKIIPFKI